MLIDLVSFIAKSIVDQPDEVSVNEIDGGSTVVFEIRVASSDMGKIIGKRGRVIHAIRSLVQAAATKQGMRATVEVLE